MNKYAESYLNIIKNLLNLNTVEDLGASGNPANHGYVHSFLPFLKPFKRPNVSDYAYVKMQERSRLANAMTPSILASNPGLKELGQLGENQLFQSIYDKYLSPGGSRVDAYKTILGGMGNQLGGTTIKGMRNAAESSANILKNLELAGSNGSGAWDYDRMSGYNKPETAKNLIEFKKVFG
jgi:hypothetical protein